MNPPKIFISATSGDLNSARQIAKEALLTINCHPVEQTNFEPDWRSVTDMLRGKISDCQALIHLVGFRYGAEPDPASLPPGTPRRSYTQLEYHLARELGLRVYTFLLPETYPFDSRPLCKDSPEQTQLQVRHRALIQSSQQLYEKPASDIDLRSRITALQEQVISLNQQSVSNYKPRAIEVFISSASEDYPKAKEVYEYLSGLGTVCFFSDATLDQIGQTEYKQVIENALEQCKHLVVVTSSRSHTEKKWVQHEWNSFDNECLSGRKDGNLVTIACEGLLPNDLPWALRNRIVLKWPQEAMRLAAYTSPKRVSRHSPVTNTSFPENRDASIAPAKSVNLKTIDPQHVSEEEASVSVASKRVMQPTSEVSASSTDLKTIEPEPHAKVSGFTSSRQGIRTCLSMGTLMTLMGIWLMIQNQQWIDLFLPGLGLFFITLGLLAKPTD